MKMKEPRPRPDSTPLHPMIEVAVDGAGELSFDEGTRRALFDWLAAVERLALAQLPGGLTRAFNSGLAATPGRLPAVFALDGIERLRRALEAGDAVLAAGEALRLGVVAEQLHAEPYIAEGARSFTRQKKRARLGRGGLEMAARNAQIVRWNQELLDASPGKRPRRDVRVEAIQRRCLQTYRDKVAEASYHKSDAEKRAAKVWKIGVDRIDDLLPRDRKK